MLDSAPVLLLPLTATTPSVGLMVQLLALLEAQDNVELDPFAIVDGDDEKLLILVGGALDPPPPEVPPEPVVPVPVVPPEPVVPPPVFGAFGDVEPGLEADGAEVAPVPLACPDCPSVPANDKLASVLLLV